MFLLHLAAIVGDTGPPRGVRGPGAKLQNEAPFACGQSEGRGRKQGNLGELNLKALLEPCRLLLFGVFMDTSKEALRKKV